MGGCKAITDLFMARILLIFFVGLSFVSCSMTKLVSQVSYRSFCNENLEREELNSLRDVPKTATIAAEVILKKNYKVDVVIYNLTDKTMSIDRTQSFFLMPDEQTSYFDPQVTMNTKSVSSSSGKSVNLGAVASAVGVGGVVGRVLGGVNVANSSSQGSSTTTYNVDQPIIHIPPRGKASLGRAFDICRIVDASSCTFGICVAYSVDRFNTIDNFISQYNRNSFIVSPVQKRGNAYYVNDALRQIYITKPDLFEEKCFVLEVNGDQWAESSLFDFQ